MMSLKVRTVRALAMAVRGRRRDLGLNQTDLARRADVSRKWLSEFEKGGGKPTAELGLVLRVLDALDLDIELSDRNRPGDATPGRINLDALLGQHRRRS